MSEPAQKHEDESPEVIALRKRIRGEPLTDAETALLSKRYRTPEGPRVPHAEIERMLAERKANQSG
jgi:hypothetical protein